MKKSQQVVLLLTAAIIVLLMLFPPWQVTDFNREFKGAPALVGHYWFAATVEGETSTRAGMIHNPLLRTEAGLVLLAGALVFLSLGDYKKRP